MTLPTDTTNAPDPPQGRTWTKSTKSSGSGCCVEISLGDIDDSVDTDVLIRDSKFPRHDPASGPEPMLRVDRPSWHSFLDEVVLLDQPIDHAVLTTAVEPDRGVKLGSRSSETVLSFTEAEWAAFVGGVIEGELR